MIKFPSIKQYRHVIQNVQRKAQFVRWDDENDHPIINKFAPMPTLNFHGTVKLHGSNSSISLDKEGNINFQSRNNIITPEKDNYGFARYMTEVVGIDLIKERLLFPILIEYPDLVKDKEVTIFGEFCGGSIQKGIALSKLDKMFVIFAIKIGNEDDSTDEEPIWLNISDFAGVFKIPEYRIFNTEIFKTFDIEIDFNNPKASQQQLVDWTIEVEEECPVGKYFGVSNVGEGIVWSCAEEGYRSSKFRFKVKGELHNSSKHKKSKGQVSILPEVQSNINEFVEYSCSENRLNQIFTQTFGEHYSDKLIGPFLSAVVKDILKEESDVIEKSKLELKHVKGAIGFYSKKWLFNNYRDSV